MAKGTITTVQSLVSSSNPYGMSCDPSVNGLMTANNETDYVLGPGGEQVTELAQDANGTMNWQRTYVYTGGGLIGTYDPDPDNPSQPLLSFRLTDWLGTMRATTDAYGVAQGTCTGLPFGDGVTCNGDIPDNHHFTGKERDPETGGLNGNDYFGARYYASTMGRFLIPDWSAKVAPVPYAKLDNPQSLNLYAYMMNNPLGGVDPDGHGGCSGANAAACAVVTDAIRHGMDAGQALWAAAKAYAKGDFGSLPPKSLAGNQPPKAPPTPNWQYKESNGETTLKVGGITVETEKPGYSGHGKGLNNPESESVGESDDKANAGPIPQGKWTIGPGYNGKKGTPQMDLTPDPGTDLFGRGKTTFLWHGDNKFKNESASEGCIVSPDASTRSTVAGSGVTDLEVVP